MSEPTLLTCGICGEKSVRVHSLVACVEALKARADAAEAELAIWRDEDGREAKYEHVSQRCTKAEEALAAARREVERLRKALERCSELFSEIRGDWTDPRSECREGQDVIRAALAAPADGEEGRHEARR